MILQASFNKESEVRAANFLTWHERQTHLTQLVFRSFSSRSKRMDTNATLLNSPRLLIILIKKQKNGYWWWDPSVSLYYFSISLNCKTLLFSLSKKKKKKQNQQVKFSKPNQLEHNQIPSSFLFSLKFSFLFILSYYVFNYLSNHKKP